MEPSLFLFVKRRSVSTRGTLGSTILPGFPEKRLNLFKILKWQMKAEKLGTWGIHLPSLRLSLKTI